MRKILWSLFSCLFVSCYLQGQPPVANTYAYPALSSLDDLSAYLSMPPSQISSLSTTKTQLPVSGLFVTVYETSSGLKDLLYVTTHFQFQEGGKTEVKDVAGPVGCKLGTRQGQSTFLSQDEKLVIFLHKDDQFPQEFTNVLQIVSEETGELLVTQGKEYLKGYVRIEKKKSTATFPTN